MASVLYFSEMFRHFLLFLIGICSPLLSYAQAGEDSLHHRPQGPLIAAGAGYAVTMTYLATAWYDGETSSFHFFNDNPQWMQLDKAGHFFAGYAFSRGMYQIWPGTASREQQALYASLTGFLMLVPVEVLDGFSPDYGASVGDLLADAGGALLFYGQQRTWGEQRLVPKFSFSRSELAALRPEVLGDGPAQEWLKDYNGQTYWLSLDMAKLLPNSGWPGWLTLDAGYGANSMLYARQEENSAAGYDSYRQYYLSPGINFSYWKGDNKVVNTLLYLANLVKVPAPTLEINTQKGPVFHFLHF